jgi:hypothetical protein
MARTKGFFTTYSNAMLLLLTKMPSFFHISGKGLLALLLVSGFGLEAGLCKCFG